MIGLGLAAAFCLGSWGTHAFGGVTGFAMYGEALIFGLALGGMVDLWD